jgi:hypothetical protein
LFPETNIVTLFRIEGSDRVYEVRYVGVWHPEDDVIEVRTLGDSASSDASVILLLAAARQKPSAHDRT